jgi:hypothetical protein
MAQQISSRYGWRWILVLIGGLSWLSIGCSPSTLSMLVLPFTDNNIDPEYKLFAADKELTVVVMSNFKQEQIQEDIRKADSELADHVSLHLRQRCDANKHKIKLIPQAQVRSYTLKQKSLGDTDPLDAGRHFKADYVLQMEINSFSLYEKLSFPKMFRGRIETNITLYKVKLKDGEDDHLVFEKGYSTEYPGSKGPIPADGASPNQFRRMFLDKASREITRLFIAYPQDEKRNHID